MKKVSLKPLEGQYKLAASPNTNVYFVAMGKDGLPMIVDTDNKN